MVKQVKTYMQDKYDHLMVKAPMGLLEWLEANGGRTKTKIKSTLSIEALR